MYSRGMRVALRVFQREKESKKLWHVGREEQFEGTYKLLSFEQYASKSLTHRISKHNTGT